MSRSQKATFFKRLVAGTEWHVSGGISTPSRQIPGEGCRMTATAVQVASSRSMRWVIRNDGMLKQDDRLAAISRNQSNEDPHDHCPRYGAQRITPSHSFKL